MKLFKKALSALLASIMCLPSGLMTTVYASENDSAESYTVTIEQPEHGMVAFSAADDEVMTASEGDTIEMILAPDEGYGVDTFMLKDADSGKTVASKKTSDNVFSFSMPARNLLATAKFSEMEDVGTSNQAQDEDGGENTSAYEKAEDIPSADDEIDEALKELNEKKDGIAIDSSRTTAYISKNIDDSAVKEAEEISQLELDKTTDEVKTQADSDKSGLAPTQHEITVNYHLVDTSKKKLAQNGFLPEDYISSSAQKQQIYTMDGNEDCFVAFINLGKLNGIGEGVTATFSNSDSAEMVSYDEIISYDTETGIVYIPKSLFYDENGKEISVDLQAQVFAPYTLEDENKNVINVSVENNSSSMKEVAETQKISVPSFDVTVTFPLLTDESSKNFDMSKIDIYINDSAQPTEFAEDEYFFDKKTGELTIATMPMTVYSIKVVIEGETIAERILDVIAPSVYADVARQIRYPSDIKMVPDVYLDKNYDDLQIGHLDTEDTTVTYQTTSAMGMADKDIVRKYFEYLCYCGNNYENSLWAAQAIYNGEPLTSYMNADFGDSTGTALSDDMLELYNYLFVLPKLTRSSTGETNQKLPLHSVILFQGAGAEGGVGNTVAADLASRNLQQKVNIRTLGKNRVNGIEYGIFGFSVYNTNNTVAAYGIYKIPVKTPVGYIQIQKESANNGVTDGNSAYTFEGAQFQIMQGTTKVTDENTGESVFTLDETGKSDTIAVPLVDGANNVTYTVQEITAPQGYKVNNQIYSVDVGINSTASNPAVVKVIEEPYTYPSDIVLNKYDKVTNYSEGDASLAGIQYEVLYYEGYDMDDFTSVSGLTPTRKWTIETKMQQDAAYKHDGSGLLSGSGTAALYGHTELKDEYLVKGKSDELYKDSDGNVIMPIGTYIVREIDAGAGYTSSGEMYIMQDGIKEPNYSSNKQGTKNPSQGLLFMVKANIPDTKDYRNDTATNGGMKVKQYETYKTTGYIGMAGNKRQTNIIYKDSTITATNEIKYGGLEIQKLDYNDKTKNPQGDANDMSSKYGVKNLGEHPVAIKSEHNIQICTWNASDSWTDEDGITWYVFEPVADNSDKYMFTFNTNYYGKWESSDNLLPYGTYRVDEITAPTGYQRNGVVVKKFNITESKQMASVKIEDMIQRGTIFLVKFDAEDHTSTNQGSGTLQGTYTIKNKSEHYVWVLDNGFDGINILKDNADRDAGAVEVTGEGTWYKFAPESDMFTFTTKPIGDFAAAWTTENPYLLSYGTYEIRETGTDDSYVISDLRGGKNRLTFSITENGQIVEFGTSDHGHKITDADAILTNPVVRGGFNIQKNDADRKEHSVDGNASSRKAQGDASFLNATYKVTSNNDNYVWIKEDDSITIFTENASNSKEIDGETWYKFLNGQDMFTFKTDKDGNYESPSDMLPYGDYTITEVTASDGYLSTDTRDSIVTLKLTISSEGQKVDKTYANDAKDNVYDDSLYEAVIRGGVKIQKNDADVKAHKFEDETPSSSIAQGDASLEGAVYDIFNISDSYVWVDTDGNGTYEDEEYYAPLDIDITNEKEITYKDVEGTTPVYSITTDENGIAQTDATTLPYGTYLIVEKTASEGYLMDTTREGIVAHTFQIREEGAIVDKLTYAQAEENDLEDTFYEPVIRGGFDFQKNDEETGKNKPLGGADLHAVFSVTNMSNNYVWIKDEEGINLNLDAEDHYYDEESGYHLYGKNEVMFTFETDKETGKFKTSTSLLPYGTYKITETVPPNGYLVESNKNSDFETTIQIREENTLADATQLIYNYVMRGDVFFEKKDAETGIKMTYIPFLITAFNKDGQPIESHIVYTDKNGSFASSENYTIHSFKTNKADETVSDMDTLVDMMLAGDDAGIEELMKLGNYYTEESIADFFEKENYGMGLGVWFGVDTTPIDGERTATLPGTGALPFGRYRLDELPCEANEGKALVHDNFTITNESCKTTATNNPLRYQLGVQAAGNINFGTIYNWEAPLAPQMTTSAAVRASDTQYSGTDSVMVITDTVHYQGIEKGKDYTLVAMVADAESGEYLRDATGDIAMESVSFKPNTTDGYQKMEISVDTKGYEGKTVVVYETLYNEHGEIYINHCNPDDKEQQIHFPSMNTGVTVEKTGKQVSNAEDNVKVIDSVSYSNLSVGTAYMVKSYLIDSETGETIVDTAGKRIESEQSFKPTASNGSFDVTFVFDATKFAGKKLIVCEEIMENGYVISSHADKTNNKQAVWIPDVTTKITDKNTGLQMTLADGQANVIDKINYKAVQPGLSYSVHGMLVDKETGNTIAENTKQITLHNESGNLDLEYHFDANQCAGKTIVAYTNIEYGNNSVAIHNNLEDADETIFVPEIQTSALDKENRFKLSKADNEVSIIDTVSYANLVAGYDYIVSGYLVDQKTGLPIEDANGEIISASNTFSAKETSGDVDVEFSFDGSKLAGKTVVVFESINAETENDVPLVAIHENINDEDQTIRIPKLTSKTVDKNNLEHITKPGDSIITDDVTYSNVIPGVEYTLSGSVVVKETKEIVAREEMKFTPDNSEGTISMEYNVDTSNLGGKTLFFTEELLYNEYSVAESNNMNDMNATIYVSSVKTSAVDGENGTHVSYADDSITIVDTVTYQNLIPGKQYVVFGKVVDQETNEVISSHIIDEPAYYERGEMHEKWTCQECGKEFNTRNEVLAHIDTSTGCENYLYELYYDKIYHEEIGHYGEVSAVKPFVASSTSGTVTMAFNFDGTGFENRTVVVYEEIYMSNEEGNVMTENFDCMQCGMHFGTKEDVEEHFRQSETGCNTYAFYYTTEMFAVAEHKERYDDSQVIHIPELTHQKVQEKSETVALMARLGLMTITKAETNASIPNGNHYIEAGKKCVINDTVTYKNLIPGLSYTIVGTLVDKETGSPTNVTSAYTFIPTEPYNDVNLTFEFDSTEYAGRLLVATETAYVNGTDVVATYNDLNDQSKTIHVVKVDSQITDDNTNDNTTSYGKTTVTDTVTAKGLKPGTTYIGKGKLVNPETGEEYKNIDSSITPVDGAKVVEDEKIDKNIIESLVDKVNEIFNPKTANETEFIATDTTAVFEIKYEIDTSIMSGESVVSFVEVVEKETNTVIGDHKDPDDENQTIYVPELVSGKIVDAYTGNKQVMFGKTAIAAELSYGNLAPGKVYKAKAILKDAENGNELAIVEDEFKAAEPTGVQQVTFYVDSSKVVGKKLTIVEELYMNDAKVAMYQADSDKDMLYVAEIVTNAVNEESESQSAPVAGKTTVVDTVTYKNLIPGEKYVVTGYLVNTDTKEKVSVFNDKGEKADKENEVSVEFVPEKSDGEVKVQFVVETQDMSGKNLVGFETITYNNVVVAEHKDSEDSSQTVYIPTISCEAFDKDTKSSLITLDDKAEVNGKVKMGNLVVGQEYTAYIEFTDGETAKKVADASYTFTAETKDTIADMKLQLDTLGYKGKTLVLSYYLKINDVELIRGEEKEFYIGNINTSVKNYATGTRMSEFNKDTKMIDTISYENLIPGEEYTIKGKLVTKKTGKVICAKEMTSEFKESKGQIDIEFETDVTPYEGTKLVAVEEIFYKGVKVASHEDLDDENQTLYIAKIGSEASISGQKEVQPSISTTLTDTVDYENLIPGYEYDMIGTIVDAATGQVVQCNGVPVTSTVSFTAEQENGTVNVNFTFDTSEMDGRKIVVYEELKYNNILISQHNDINDAKQTVLITNKSAGNTTNNGGESNNNPSGNEESSGKENEKENENNENRKNESEKSKTESDDNKKDKKDNSSSNKNKSKTKTNTGSKSNTTTKNKTQSNTSSNNASGNSNSVSKSSQVVANKGDSAVKDVKTGDTYKLIILLILLAPVIGAAGLFLMKKKK